MTPNWASGSHSHNFYFLNKLVMLRPPIKFFSKVLLRLNLYIYIYIYICVILKSALKSV